MTAPVFKQITIIGVGLIGGSIARAALEKGAAGEVVLFDGNADALRRAGEIGFRQGADFQQRLGRAGGIGFRQGAAERDVVGRGDRLQRGAPAVVLVVQAHHADLDALDRAIRQHQRVEAQAREMVAQLHNDLSGLAYRFKAPLQEYARRLIESSGRKGQRSVKTLSGTLGFRGGDDCKPTLSVADPERLREWCLEQPDAEQFGAYTFVPDKAKVLAWAKATGEVPRGVEAKSQPEAFYVKSADGVSVNLSKLSAPALPAPDEPEEE